MLAFQQRWTAHRHHTLSEEAVGDETGVATAPASYGGVDAVALEVGQLQRGREPHVDVRVSRAEILEPRDQPLGCEDRRDTQDQRTPTIVLPQCVHRPLQLGEARSQPGKKRLAGVGQEQRIANATEEPDREIVLQRLYLMADRGDGDAQLVRGLRDAQVTARCLEGAERVEGGYIFRHRRLCAIGSVWREIMPRRTRPGNSRWCTRVSVTV